MILSKGVTGYGVSGFNYYSSVPNNWPCTSYQSWETNFAKNKCTGLVRDTRVDGLLLATTIYFLYNKLSGQCSV